MNARRFPPPWFVEDIDAAFVVKDSNGQKLPEFTDLFCRIRDFQVNWSAIAAASSPVSLINLSRTGPLTLGSAFVAWYTRDGRAG
jgi:hypothetical protein